MASEPKVPDTQLQAETGPVDAIPSTPPKSDSRALPTQNPGTAVKSKATNSQPFASGLQDRALWNEVLGREMKGHFSGIMPPGEFLDRYLPLNSINDQEREPSKAELGTCLGIIPCTPEIQMYEPFIKAIKPYLKDMDISDTHAFPDTERDNLMPDVALYSKKVEMVEKRTYFPEMSTFVEFKVSTTADPFVDPPTLSSLPADFCFEREEPDMKKNRGQIASYSAAISGTQFRTHVFSVSVCDRTARFVLWDRSGALVTARFDYVQNPDLLIGFFYRYSRLTREQQGYDPTASEGPAPEEELAVLSESGFMERMQEANKHHQEFRTLMVPDRDDPSEEMEKPFLISYPPYYETRSPFSRATRAMLAFDLTRRRLVFLKDYWRANVDGMEKEGEIYRLLQAKNVPHIAPFGMGNDVRNQETRTHALINQTPPLSWLLPTAGQICLRHYRMTLDAVGRSLTDFHSSHQFISAIADAMEAHDGAFFDCRVLHRDISAGNIILTDDHEGLLIDWDLCTKLDDDDEKQSPVARRPTRTGTWQFMSVMLLTYPSIRHRHHDDRESAFYVLLWTGLRYTKTEAAPGSTYTSQNTLRGFDELFVDSAGRELGGDHKKALLRAYRNEGIVFTERPELDSLMAELAPVFDVRYRTEPTAEEIATLKDALTEMEALPAALVNATRKSLVQHPAYNYQETMNKLEMRGWLVDTIRKYLGMGNWPKDESCAQVTVPSYSKRKAEMDQAILDSRATKRHSSLRPNRSSQRSSQTSLRLGQPSLQSSRSSARSSRSLPPQ